MASRSRDFQDHDLARAPRAYTRLGIASGLIATMAEKELPPDQQQAQDLLRRALQHDVDEHEGTPYNTDTDAGGYTSYEQDFVRRQYTSPTRDPARGRNIGPTQDLVGSQYTVQLMINKTLI